MNYYATARGEEVPTTRWSHSLFGCFDDFGECLLVFTTPCVIYGLNAREAGLCSGCHKDCALICGCLFCLFFPESAMVTWCCCIRPNIRHKYGIQGNCCEDGCAVFLCPCFALLQERKQLKEIYRAPTLVIQPPVDYHVNYALDLGPTQDHDPREYTPV